MNIFKLSLLNCAVSLALLSAGAQAATVDVSKLGTELTPFGAEKAGNADGSIPAWTGGLTKAPEGWAPARRCCAPTQGIAAFSVRSAR